MREIRVTPLDRLRLRAIEALLTLAALTWAGTLRGGEGMMVGLVLALILWELDRWAVREWRRA